MAEQYDVDQIAEAARAALEQSIQDKTNSVRDLASASQRRVDAAAALDTATADHSAAWDHALTLGWTAPELRRLGLDEPGKKAPARGRVRKPRPAPAVAPAVAGHGDQGDGGGSHESGERLAG